MEEHTYILLQRGFSSHPSEWLIKLPLLWLFTFSKTVGKEKTNQASEDIMFSELAGSGSLFS